MKGKKHMKIGDVVYLKSGGPAMTIRNEHMGTEHVDVVWFTTSGEAEETTLHTGCLTEQRPKSYCPENGQ